MGKLLTAASFSSWLSAANPWILLGFHSTYHYYYFMSYVTEQCKHSKSPDNTMPHNFLVPYFCGFGLRGLGCVTQDKSMKLSELWTPQFQNAGNTGCCDDEMKMVTEDLVPVTFHVEP